MKRFIVKRISDGLLYMMDPDDKRIGDTHEIITTILDLTPGYSSYNNRKCRIATTESGAEYDVFYDWSARLTEK
jgi:hypothetical protein